VKKNSSHTHKTGFWRFLGVLSKISDEYRRNFYMGDPRGRVSFPNNSWLSNLGDGKFLSFGENSSLKS